MLEVPTIERSNEPIISLASGERDKVLAPPFSAKPVTSVRRKVWAFLVGISKYRNKKDINLDFARKDAEDLEKHLTLPEYGDIPKAQICMLLDEEATLLAIIGELRTFLKKPAKEDVVILFFSCHGELDRVDDDREVPYLLPHDVNPQNLAASALPMRELMASIQDYLLAERIIILSDACYSGGLIAIPERKKSADDDQKIDASHQRYLANVKSTFGAALSDAGGGIAMLCSSRSNEVSKEVARFGNGLFTHFLLKGLRGIADELGNRDNIVTLRELFQYVCDSVSKSTNGKQRPIEGPWKFDGSLPVSVVGGINAQERRELADSLFELAVELADPMRFLSAARQYRLAKIKGVHDSSVREAAQLGEAKALALAGHPEAEAQLALAAQTQNKELAEDAELYRARWSLERNRPDDAITALRRFTSLGSDDARKALFSKELAKLEQLGPQKRRWRALLIGISQLPQVVFGATLKGPKNDVTVLKRALLGSGLLADDDICTLVDSQATVDGLTAALEALAAQVRHQDVIFVHFSGEEPARDVSGRVNLLLFDTIWTDLQKVPEKSLTIDVLHRAMEKIPCAVKILSMDVCNKDGVSELSDQVDALASYELWLSANPGASAREHTCRVEQENTDDWGNGAVGEAWVLGVYSHVLARQINAQTLQPDKLDLLWQSVEAKVTGSAMTQHPTRHIGMRRIPLPRSGLLGVLDLILQRSHPCRSLAAMRDIEETLANLGPLIQEEIWLALAKNYASHKMWPQVSDMINRCPEAKGGPCAFIALRALAAGEHELALQAMANSGPQEVSQGMLQKLQAKPRHALILSAQTEFADVTPTRALAYTWSSQTAALLQQRFLFSCEILEARALDKSEEQIRRLAQSEKPGPLVIIALGDGIRTSELGIGTGDSNSPLLCLSSLLEQLRGSQRPIIIFADHSIVGLSTPHRELSVLPRLCAHEDLLAALPTLGVSVWLVAVDPFALTQLLRSVEEPSLTFGSLRENPNFAVVWPPADSLEGARVGPVFGDDAEVGRLLLALRELESQAARDVLRKGQRLHDGSGVDDPDLLLNLAVAESVLGSQELARFRLEQILRLPELRVQTEIRAESNLRLAHILMEKDDDLSRAISLLNEVCEKCPDWAQAHYYLAQALRAQAERGLQNQAATAYRKYMMRGAPIGHESEIESFLLKQSAKARDVQRTGKTMGDLNI